MAFTALTSAEIDTGEPVKKEVMTKIKDNFDDHESRITSNENAVQNFTPFNFAVDGAMNTDLVGDGLLALRLFTAETITGVKVQVHTAGTAGNLDIDVEKSTDDGSTWNTILTGVISTAYTAGDWEVTSGTISGTQNLSVGDLLRINVDAVQTDGVSFTVYVEHEVT